LLGDHGRYVGLDGTTNRVKYGTLGKDAL